MALRRDTARNLEGAATITEAFVTGVAREIEAKRIKPEEGAKLILWWNQDRDRVWRAIEYALSR